MTPTPEQQAIIDATFDSALKAVAFAGTGKTSTFVAYADARPKEDMLYLAFNKSVETEARSKFGPNVLPKTVHALAYRHVGRKFPNLGNLKYFQVAKAFGLDTYRASLVTLTLESFWNSADDDFKETHVPDDTLQMLGPTYRPAIIDIAKIVWRDMQAGANNLPMSHNGYLKLYQLERPIIDQNTILLDEAQDTNPVTLALIDAQRAYGTRVLLCGDPFQQIYSWRGAIDAMDMVEAPTMYLTQSFRFGPAIADAANKLLWSFFPSNKTLRGLDNIPASIVSSFPLDAQRTIICRTNAELFRNAVAHDSIHVVGVEGFSDFLATVYDIYYLYAGKRENVRSKQIAFFRSFDRLMEFAEQRLDNELQGKINLVLQYKDSIPGCIARIRANQTIAENAKVILVTGHKSKGLEWDNVELAEDFADLFDEGGKLLPIETEDVDGVAKDEINLLYVALTRAKKLLKPNMVLSRVLSK